MLILTFKLSEYLCIGDTRIKVVPGGGTGTVRLGIEAPEDVIVLRQEVWLREQGRARDKE